MGFSLVGVLFVVAVVSANHCHFEVTGGGCASGPNGDTTCTNRCKNEDEDVLYGQCEDIDGDGVAHECICYTHAAVGISNCDPLYMTYGRSYYSSQTMCEHTLARSVRNSKLPRFEVHQQNKCLYKDSTGACRAAYAGQVTLHVYGKTVTIEVVSARRERSVYIDGQRIHGNYQWTDGSGRRIHIMRQAHYSWVSNCADCLTATVWTDFGLQVRAWSYRMRADVIFPKISKWTGQVEGALGHFDNDNDRTNDLRMPNNQFFPTHGWLNEQDGDNFISQWFTKSKGDRECKSARPKRCLPPIEREAEEKCAIQSNPAFAECFNGPYFHYWYALKTNIQRYGHYSWFKRQVEYMKSERYQTAVRDSLTRYAGVMEARCKADMCLIEKPNHAVDNGACDALTWFVRNCRQYKASATIGSWRSRNFCPLDCPANAEYSDCAGCEKSCDDMKGKSGKGKNSDCDCNEGCVCKSGFVMDENSGNCVRRSECNNGNNSGSNKGGRRAAAVGERRRAGTAAVVGQRRRP